MRMTEGRIRLGGELQRRRKLMGLSQEELAQRMNVSRQSVTKWETGQSAPDLDRLIQLSEELRVSLDDLLKTPAPSADALPSGPPADADPNSPLSERAVSEPLFPPRIPAFFLWGFGCLLLTTGAAGLATLWVLSVLHPVQLTDWDGTRTDGLWGYILTHELHMLLFAALGASLGGVLLLAVNRWRARPRRET